MLAGEYLALFGLETFAFPIHYGQKLAIWESSAEGSTLKWFSKNHKGETWFKSEIDTLDFLEKSTENATVSGRICELLSIAKKLNPSFKLQGTYMVETELEFNQVFGLGSSSTLVALIAQWAKVDVMELQEKVFGGSGYDAAVCSVQKPLIYWKSENAKPNWSFWSMDETISKDWFLCFPGKKVNSRRSLDAVKQKLELIASDSFMMAQLDNILQQIKSAKDASSMELSLEIWQAFISQSLGLKTAYEDLKIERVKGGLCKYLGAWGGDVILVNKQLLENNKDKFEPMQVIPWNELVINK